MKKALLLLFPLMIFISCGDKEDEEEVSTFVGTWNLTFIGTQGSGFIRTTAAVFSGN